MRNFIAIIETTTSGPSWWLAGKAVDITAYEETEYFLEDDEWDYEWRLCRIPSSDLSEQIGSSWDAFVSDLAETPEEEEERIAAVEQWYAEHGVEKALTINPPIFLLGANGLDLVDGHHRCGIAVHRHGLKVLPALVGLRPR